MGTVDTTGSGWQTKADDIALNWMETTDAKTKKHWELECYKLLKAMDFDQVLIDYLKDNDAESLAKEMAHFSQLFHKAPHTHETHRAA